MLNTIAIASVILDGWGMIGIWTDRFGFHNTWEFWVRDSPYGWTSVLLCTNMMPRVRRYSCSK